MIIESDLAHRDHLGMLQQFRQIRDKSRRSPSPHHADAHRPSRRSTDNDPPAEPRFQIRRPVAGPDRDHRARPRPPARARSRPRDRRRIVRCPDGSANRSASRPSVHFSRAPRAHPPRKLTSAGLPPSSDAATIIPCDSNPFNFRGCKIRHDHHLPPDQCLGLVSPRDSRHDAARLRLADIHLQMQQLVRPLHRRRFLHQADAQIDFQKIVDGDLRSLQASPDRRTSCPAPPAAARILRLPAPASFRSTALASARGNTPLTAPSICPASRCPQCRSRVRTSVTGVVNPSLRPDLRRRLRNHRRQQRRHDAQRLRRRVQRLIQQLPEPPSPALGQLPRRPLDDKFVHARDQPPDRFQRFRKLELLVTIRAQLRRRFRCRFRTCANRRCESGTAPPRY